MTEIKKNKDTAQILEIIVVIMLGITALFTAWASWVGSLHGGNQATNYTRSNNIAAEGNSEYNAGVQNMMQDMMLWNAERLSVDDLEFLGTRELVWSVDGPSGQKLVFAHSTPTSTHPVNRANESDEVFIEMSNGHSPALIKCDQPFLYVLMPLRVN